MGVEIKPCPFCGSTNVHARTVQPIYYAKQRGYSVICLDCFARGTFVPNEKYGKTSHSAEAKREAIEAWNNCCLKQELHDSQETMKLITDALAMLKGQKGQE